MEKNINYLVEPCVEVDDGFQMLLFHGRKQVKEIKSREMFHLVNTHGISTQCTTAVTVGVYERNHSHRSYTWRHYYLEVV